MLQRYLRARYASLRGGQEVSPTVPAPALLNVAARKAIDLIRGTVCALLYGDSGGMHFRGARASVRHGRYLHIGRGVALDSGTRIDAFSRSGVWLGDRVTVGANTSILGSGVIREPGEGITVGPDTAIGSQSVIWGQGGVSIGSDCLFGPQVVLVSENHKFDDRRSPIRRQGSERAAIRIGNDCWVGAGVRILAGVSVGDGAVIGAGAVVTTDVPALAVAVGVPARIVAWRGGA